MQQEPPRIILNEKEEQEGLADYQVLQEALTLLPKNGRWKPRQRALWIKAFISLLDYLTDEPPCESADHHACKHYREVAQNAVDASREMDWCSGCSAERPYDNGEAGKYEHEKDCPLAAIVQGEL